MPPGDGPPEAPPRPGAPGRRGLSEGPCELCNVVESVAKAVQKTVDGRARSRAPDEAAACVAVDDAFDSPLGGLFDFAPPPAGKARAPPTIDRCPDGDLYADHIKGYPIIRRATSNFCNCALSAPIDSASDLILELRRAALATSARADSLRCVRV